MQSIKFEEVTNTIAENQEEYDTIFVNTQKVLIPGTDPIDELTTNQVTVCFQLSDQDIINLHDNGYKIWYTQLGNGFAPMNILTTKPQL